MQFFVAKGLLPHIGTPFAVLVETEAWWANGTTRLEWISMETKFAQLVPEHGSSSPNRGQVAL